MASPLNKLLEMDDDLYNCFSAVSNRTKLLEESGVTEEEFSDKKIHRPACMKLIWGYIKEKDLQDPTDKRTIKCDDVLKSLFGEENVSMFKLAGGINQHLTSL